MPNQEQFLFELTNEQIRETSPELKKLEAPVWTENKALLIQRYLRYFVFITKHGTYIDAFSGPQSPDHPGSWAAKLVLESEPRWFRNFFFFEEDKEKIGYLTTLVASQPDVRPKRQIKVFPGDMNQNLPAWLKDNPVSEASFCLLDQHTFECHWSTVEAIARHKQEGNKIELFYFLCQGWLDRAAAALKDKSTDLTKWWGNEEWDTLLKKPCWDRGRFFAERLKREFGYKYAMGYPIYEKDGGVGKIMFWMIHASDHPEAPKLMVRAYNRAVAPLEPIEQLNWEFSGSDERKKEGESKA